MRAISLILAGLIVPALSAFAFSQGNGIKREIDPIVIQGSQLPDFNGIEISKLRLFALKKSGMEPIPFQVDERDPKGRYVMTHGKGAGKDNDAGKLDNNDEVLFIARDLGGRANKDKWPDGVKKGLEITVTDPVNSAKGYAYLFSFDNAPPYSSKDYVKFDPKSQRVYGRNYILGYDIKKPITEIYFASPVDKLNMRDTFKLKFRLVLKIGGIKVNKTQKDFKSKLKGYIDGPIRVTRRTSSSMLILKLPTPKMESDIFYWPDYCEMPAVFKVPFDFSKIVKKFTWITSLDHNRNAIGAIFYNSNNPKGVRIDGVMSESEKSMDLAPPEWGVTKFKNVAVLSRSIAGKTLKYAKAMQFYVDDNSIEDKPEVKPGQIGHIGSDIKGLEKLKKGIHIITTYSYFMKSYKPGDEKGILNIVDKPLKVSIEK